MSNTADAGRDDRDPTNWESPEPLDRIEGTGRNEGNAIQFSWWNLLLLVPLLMLFTPLYNSEDPRLLGMPKFYWYQFGFVFVGVVCVAVVYLTTRNRRPSGVQRGDRRQNRDGEGGGR